MAKKRKLEPQPETKPAPKWPIFAAGAVAAALIVFAMLRTTNVAPSDPSATSTVSSPADVTAPTVPPVTASAPTETAPMLPPLESSRAQGAPFLPQPAPQQPEPATSDAAKIARMTPEELHEKFQAKQVTIVDVRDAASYAGGHIQGAVHIPFASIESEGARLPKDKQIVLYCT